MFHGEWLAGKGMLGIGVELFVCQEYILNVNVFVRGIMFTHPYFPLNQFIQEQQGGHLQETEGMRHWTGKL